MSLLRDEKKEEDEQSCYSSDCSSSFSSSSSCHSSSSNASSSYDGSDRSSSSFSSSRRGRNNQLRAELQYEEDSFFRLSSLMRHRRTITGGFQRDCEEGRQMTSNRKNKSKHKYENTLNGSHSSKNIKRRRGGNKRRNSESPHWSSSLLAIALLIWCGVQIATTEYVQTISTNLFYYDEIKYGSPHKKHPNGNANDGRSHQRQNHPPFPHRPPPIKKKGLASKKEVLQPGCELDRAWQTPETNSKLLSCQLLHELDLSEALSTVSSARESSRRQRSLSSSTHLGSGLWRDVWKIRDNNIIQNNNRTKDASHFVVLKTMKPEHEVIHRNLERHRREAATMSRLTKSPYVADLFAYCGNSILTEFATQDLSNALNTKTRRYTKDNHNERREVKNMNRARRADERMELEPRLGINTSTGSTIDDSENDRHLKSREIRSNISRKVSASAPLSSSLSTTLPLATRIDWALQASKAIADMHQSDVIHADITTKQFLIISSLGGARKMGNDNLNHNVQVKINDFNRCRFVPRRQNSQANEIPIELVKIASAQSALRNETGICTIRIPSAPGSYRSPEEYSDKPLTPQMDVFSLGHVLYEIWTSGQTLWHDVGGKRIKKMVMDGVLPTELKKLKDWDDHTERSRAINIADVRNKDFSLDEIERAFGRVISQCYLVDPERRITADALVQELTQLLDIVPKQNTA